jgi:hypothetical protein
MTDHIPSICFYIRCWITRHAVQVSMQRKGKARASVAPRELSGSEDTDVEQPRMALGPHSMKPPGSPSAAPEAPSMLPPTKTMNTRARHDESSPKASNMTVQQSPTTLNKRKAPIVLRQPGSGKIQKVIKEDPSSDVLPRVRQRDIYSVPISPAPVFQTLLTNFVHRRQRESTCDTDRTYAPPRETTVETDDAIEQGDIMLDTQGQQ